jgi:uncharacterized protein (TIGR02285 family)
MAVFAFTLALATQSAAAAVTLYYNERPPYAVTAADGHVQGLTATPAARAFAAAGVAVQWVRLPSNRQILSIKDNRAPECALGWFRNAEREQFARYSKPLYQDRPTVALAHRAFQPAGRFLPDALSQPDVVVLVKERFSYGAYIDELIARLKPTLTVTTVENALMLQMLARRRADFMFAAQEEADALLEQAGAAARDLQLLRFEDMPEGEKRYLMCSKSVPDEVMQRIDAAIPDL